MYNLYMSEMSVSEARAEISDVVARAEYAGETVYLTKHGRRAGAVVSATAAELLEDIEDLVDIQAVEEVRARLADGTEQRRRFLTTRSSSAS